MTFPPIFKRDKPTAVYRVRGRDDRLLYVGCSIAPWARAMLRRWIGKADLTDRQRDVLARRLSGETMDEAAKVHGVTRERVRQMELRALSKIRRIAIGRGVDCIEKATA